MKKYTLQAMTWRYGNNQDTKLGLDQDLCNGTVEPPVSGKKKELDTRGHTMHQNMSFRTFKTFCYSIIRHRVNKGSNLNTTVQY